MQFEKADTISSIDVCNSGTAFIEVLVGSSAWDANHPYEVVWR